MMIRVYVKTSPKQHIRQKKKNLRSSILNTNEANNPLDVLLLREIGSRYNYKIKHNPLNCQEDAS
jgi:hypothetical protein